MKELTHISLFTGIAGIDLAAEWAGFRTILFVEIDSFCQKVLNKHWPDVPIIGDIKDVTRERVMAYTEGRESGEQETRNRGKDTSRGSEEETIANATSQRPQNKTNKQELEEERGGELQSEQPRDTEALAFTQSGGQYPQRQTIREGEKCPKPRSPNQYEGGRAGENNAIKPVTLITGGFPCQPVSQAGKRRGKADDRWLWPEMLRVISEVRPTWVVAENVTGLLNMGFNDCVSDLESAGYETISFVIPACGVNAPHRRDRIFIVGYTEHAGYDATKVTGSIEQGSNNSQTGQEQASKSTRPGEQYGAVADSQGSRIGQELGGIANKLLSEDRTPQEFESSSRDVANTGRKRLQGAIYSGDSNNQARSIKPGSASTREDCKGGEEQWAVEPDVGRVAYGIPSRVDRLKCLGNAVVPPQIYPILKAIADIEIGNR